MLFDGIKLVEGSEVQNLVVDNGTQFPLLPDLGELFYRTDSGAIGLYVYDGTTWNRIADTHSIFSVLGFTPVNRAGDTMQGTLVLNADPTSALQAATKGYVDSAVSAGVPTGITPGTYTKLTVNAAGAAVSGSNPTTLFDYGITDAQPLDSDLSAIAGISATSGLLRKTAANTWSLDTNTYITGNQTITLTGDVTGSGTTSISAVLSNTGVAAGSYGTATAVPQFTVDSHGRITNATNALIAIDASAVTSGQFADARIAQSNVTQHQAALSIDETQITNGSLLARVADNEVITGAWTFNNPVTGVTPVSASQLTTKSYVDNVAAGVNPQRSVEVATTGPITLSGLQAIDGYTTLDGDRVLVKDQSSAVDNGVYIAGSSAWARASDFDGSPTNEVQTGALVYVSNGTANGNSSWVLISGTGNIAVGTDPMVFSVFSRPGDFTAGNGLYLTGHDFNVGTASSSRIVVNADNIDLALTGVAGGTYATVTVDTWGRVTAGTANVNWSNVANTPTTISGYGITDAQPLNATLTAFAGLATTGFVSRTGSGSAIARSIVVSGTGLSIINADGISGDPTITINSASANTPSTVVVRDSSGNFAAGTISAALSGNASTATALATGRNISITGDVSGTTSSPFDGTGNATINVALSSTGVTAGTYKSVTVGVDGRVTGGTNPTTLAGYGITDALSTSSTIDGGTY